MQIAATEIAEIKVITPVRHVDSGFSRKYSRKTCCGNMELTFTLSVRRRAANTASLSVGSPHCARQGIGRRLFEIGQNNASPLHSVRRLRARSRNHDQCPALVRIHRQCNNPSLRNHGLPPATPCRFIRHIVWIESSHNILIIWSLSTSYEFRIMLGATDLHSLAVLRGPAGAASSRTVTKKCRQKAAVSHLTN
jgi:hypothetical protein